MTQTPARSAVWLCGLAAMVVSSALMITVHGPTVAVAMTSKFARKIDENKLNKQWQDEEDEEWHEDTYEWKEKMRSQVQFDPNNPSSFLKASSGGMQMAFTTLHDDLYSLTETQEMAKRWQALLSTNGVKSTVYAIDPGNMLITNDDGSMFEIKAFMLAQPEVSKFRWKDNDYESNNPRPDGKPAKGSKKPSKKKGSKASKKAGKGKGMGKGKGKGKKKSGKKETKKATDSKSEF